MSNQKKLFGTDGIRGESTKFPFDNNTLFLIGRAVAETLKVKQNKILIIRDTRESGKRIEKALAAGIVAAGKKVVFGGVMQTPAASLLLRSGDFAAGIVISASHNPYQDNGIKIFNSKGDKLVDSVELKIEKKISALALLKNVKQKKAAGISDSSLLTKYEKFILSTVKGLNLKGKTIVIDCANGAAYKTAPQTLKKLGAKVIALNVKPDGKNINKNCGALHPEIAAEAVKKYKAFCGFAFDGDADRLICIDENGIVKDGDFFLSAMAKYLRSKGKLKNNILVTTVMANIGLFKAMKVAKIKTVVSKVGDRYVLEDLKKYKASIGGEQSGHFIFLDLLKTGDGLLSAVQILAALADTKLSLSNFVAGVEKFPQILVNRKTVEKLPLEKLPKTSALIKKYEKSFGDNGRVLVRYSGTENLIRVMVEGKNKAEITKAANEIINLAESEIAKICGK